MNRCGIFAARIVTGHQIAVGTLRHDRAHQRALAGVAVAAATEHAHQPAVARGWAPRAPHRAPFPVRRGYAHSRSPPAVRRPRRPSACAPPADSGAAMPAPRSARFRRAPASVAITASRLETLKRPTTCALTDIGSSPQCTSKRIPAEVTSSPSATSYARHARSPGCRDRAYSRCTGSLRPAVRRASAAPKRSSTLITALPTFMRKDPPWLRHKLAMSPW